MRENRVSLSGRLMGLSTSLLLHPLLRRGNAARATRWALELLGMVIGQSARGTTWRRDVRGGVAVAIVTPARPHPGTTVIYRALPPCSGHGICG